MRKITRFISAEPVLCAATLLAVVSVFFVPPDAAYPGYINFSVLSLLFCLMAVVAALRNAGAFDSLSAAVTRRIKSEKALAAVLTAICFFSAMFITNDVALITFVPLTIGLMAETDEKKLVYVLVCQTVAANLGSAATPIGNPQNLYLYSRYSLEIGSFFSVMLPLSLVSLVLTAGLVVFFRGGELKKPESSGGAALKKLPVAVSLALFVFCILTVLKLVPWYISLAAVVIALLVIDRRAFLAVDYKLLITFVCFFVFVGNAARIAAVRQAVSTLLTGRELLVSALLSQVISNVPAATMLASFTESSRGLLLGTNIGGLGTLIASMASLITYRFYCAREKARKGFFFAVFTALNFSLFALLLAAAFLFM